MAVIQNISIFLYYKWRGVSRKLKNFINFWSPHLALINTLLVVLLIISTCKSISATNAATNATNSIRILEDQLYKLKIRDEIKDKIYLGTNLYLEMEANKLSLNSVKNSVVVINHTNERLDTSYSLKLKELQESIDSNGFGNLEMRLDMELLLKDSNSLNSDLVEIENSIAANQNHNRVDHWNSAKRKAADLLSRYINFQEKLKAYLNSLEGELQNINKQLY